MRAATLILAVVGLCVTTTGASAQTHATETLRSDPEESNRLDAVATIVDEVRLEGVGTLIQSLGVDPSARVRAACAEALGELGDTQARPALVRAAESDRAPVVRRAAVRALALLDPRAPCDLPPGFNPDAVYLCPDGHRLRFHDTILHAIPSRR